MTYCRCDEELAGDMGSLVEEEEDVDNETGLEGGLQGVEERRPEFAVSLSGVAESVYIFLSSAHALRFTVRSRFKRHKARSGQQEAHETIDLAR